MKEISSQSVLTVADLIKALEQSKGIDRIVTDVGASMISGWGDLCRIEICEINGQKILELIFK